MLAGDRLGALTPEQSALCGALDAVYAGLEGETGLEAARLRELVARASAPIIKAVAPDVGDWARPGAALITRATMQGAGDDNY